MAAKAGLKWTYEEDQYLHESVGFKSYNAIAKKLSRSVEAVKRRAQRLGLEDKHLVTGALSARELSQIVGVDVKTPVMWIKELGLKGEQKVFEYGEDKKHKPYFIYPEDFWKWAGKPENRKRIDFSKIERGVLLPEPDWLDEQAKEDYHTLQKLRRYWTEEEDDKAWKMYYEQGMLQKDIAKVLKRNRTSVEKRLKRLREKRLSTC